VAIACETLDEPRAHECATAFTWVKEKTNARHLEQQLAAAQEIIIFQDDDDDRSVNAGSNPNIALVACDRTTSEMRGLSSRIRIG
jgi:hypothetical protein